MPAGFCPFCGYRVDAGRCPECGRDVKRPWRVTPRTYRRGRLAIVLAALALVAGGAWWFGPGLAARYTPSSVLVWLWDRNGIGSKWASDLLQARFTATLTSQGRDGVEAWRMFLARMSGDPDWTGAYEQPRWWALGGQGLALSNTDVLLHAFVGMHPAGVLLGGVREFDGACVRLALPGDAALRRWAGWTLQGWFEADLVLVRWGTWRFLVPPAALLEFCNDVNASEPLEEWHLTRRPAQSDPQAVDVPRPPCSDHPPALPAGYERYMLRAAIEMKVSRVHDQAAPSGRHNKHLLYSAQFERQKARFYTIELRTDRGADAFVGMRLYSADRLGIAYVVAIRGGTVSAAYVELVRSADAARLAPGAVLSTRAPPPIATNPELGRSNPSTYVRGAPTWNDASTPGRCEIASLRRGTLLHEWALHELALELWRAE